MKLIMMSIKFIYSISSLLLFIIFLIILIGIYVYYRRTLPELGIKDKTILSLLRLIALIFIILSIGEFAIVSITKKIDSPVTAILVDDSKSIYNEQKIIKEKLNKLLNQLKSVNQKVEVFAFNENIRSINPDSINQIDFSGHSTNISLPINQILKNQNEKNYQNVILITDGIYNSGENPIYSTEKSEIPIFIFGVGDPKPKIDISIDEIITNDLVYAQNKTPIKVNIKSNGFENQIATISFFEDNRLIEKRNFQLQGNYQELEFFYEPEKDGEKKLNFLITPLKNEYTNKNNYSSKYIKVLSNRIKVLTIAGKPSYDLSFINQSIKTNKDLHLETIIEKNNGSFYPLLGNESFIDSADVIFLIGFPSLTNSDMFIRKIHSKIERDNTPLFILINPDTDFNRLNLFKQFLPFDWRSAFGTASQIYIDVPEEKSKNEILDISTTNSALVWNSFPPIYRIDREFLSKPESEILAYYKIGNNRINQPLIVSRNLNRHRSIAFLGFNIWRLKLLNAMKEEETLYLDRFINNSVKWLISRESEKNFKVQVSKKIFDVNEKITFVAQFYDNSNQPVENEKITLDILDGKNKIATTVFKPIGNGLYTAEFENFQKGDFSFQATAEFSGKKFFDKGRFSVTETELEFRDLQLREELLKRMAFVTRGSYIHISNSDEFLKNLNNYLIQKPKEREVSSIFYFWNSTYTLVSIILFLSLEWFLRKRWGLL